MVGAGRENPWRRLPRRQSCVYFGSQENWGSYRREVLAQQLANEAQMTAILNQEAWDWGPWGWP